MGTLKLTGNEPFLETPQVVEQPKDTAPFLIAIDTREQHPFEFQGLGKRVFTVTQTLQTGDYSILVLDPVRPGADGGCRPLPPSRWSSRFALGPALVKFL